VHIVLLYNLLAIVLHGLVCLFQFVLAI